MAKGIVRGWEFKRDVDPAQAEHAALNTTAAPTVWGRVVDDDAGVLSFQIVQGRVGEPEGLLFVSRHGLFRVRGADRDPSTGQLRLTLRAMERM